MTNTLHIAGFKCFSSDEFTLKNLTVLTGNNGTGKSSLIQAILLIRSGIEKNIDNSNNFNYMDTNWKGILTPLNLGYELSLGTVYDIFNEKSESSNKIKIRLDKELFEISLPDTEDKNYSVKIKLVNSDFNNKSSYIPFWRRKEFYYLHTERLGPRFNLASNYTEFLHCGYRGEFVSQILLGNPFLKIKGSRVSENSNSTNLPQQVDAWLNFICPGTSILSEPLGSMNSLIRIRNSAVKKDKLAPNMGFGISYSLPIIVSGLIAKEESVFIVENPEAHLHPKGQSNIGFFLGKVAASGVKIILETHSEHVVNGIRKAILSDVGLNSQNVAIYFFNDFDKKGQRIIPINIHPNGDLSDFPLDFFDQARQDLSDILKLSKR